MLLKPWLQTLQSLTRNSKLLGVMVACVLITLVLLGAFIGLVAWGFLSTEFFATAWLETGVDIAGGLLAFIIAWFAAPIIMPAIAGLFEEYIVKATYHAIPNSPEGKEPPFFQSLYYDSRFAVKGLLYNILVLPLYLIPVVNVFVYYVLNGYLLGRSFFLITARWHTGDTKNALSKYNQHKKMLFAHGVVLSFLATIPLASIFIPFIGIVLMTHIYRGIR